MTLAEAITWLRSLPKGERYQQAQVYAKRGVPGWTFEDLMYAAGHTLDCAILCRCARSRVY